VGADDNASGTSGVIEVARVLANCQYKRTIRLLLFSNEERGVVGSANYAEDVANAGDDILGMYGVDMIGYGPADEDLDACTKVADAFLAHAVETASNLYVGLPIFKDIDDQCG
jgi:Zn-dependent M28 family amino/carboxypeptidase